MSMPRYTERIHVPAKVDDSATLSFEKRQKTRLRIQLDDAGTEACLCLPRSARGPRGAVLRDGDLLRATDATIIRIIAAAERVSTVTSDDAGLLARAAYHLGNRHAAVQIGDGWIRYLRDHVFDAMLTSLGYTVAHQHAPFEPEGGAYRTGHVHPQAHPHAHRTEHA